MPIGRLAVAPDTTLPLRVAFVPLADPSSTASAAYSFVAAD